MQDFDKKLGLEQGSRVLTSSEQEGEQTATASGSMDAAEHSASQQLSATQPNSASAAQGKTMDSVKGNANTPYEQEAASSGESVSTSEQTANATGGQAGQATLAVQGTSGQLEQAQGQVQSQPQGQGQSPMPMQSPAPVPTSSQGFNPVSQVTPQQALQAVQGQSLQGQSPQGQQGQAYGQSYAQGANLGQGQPYPQQPNYSQPAYPQQNPYYQGANLPQQLLNQPQGYGAQHSYAQGPSYPQPQYQGQAYSQYPQANRNLPAGQDPRRVQGAYQQPNYQPQARQGNVLQGYPHPVAQGTYPYQGQALSGQYSGQPRPQGQYQGQGQAQGQFQGQMRPQAPYPSAQGMQGQPYNYGQNQGAVNYGPRGSSYSPQVQGQGYPQAAPQVSQHQQAQPQPQPQVAPYQGPTQVQGRMTPQGQGQSQSQSQVQAPAVQGQGTHTAAPQSQRMVNINSPQGRMSLINRALAAELIQEPADAREEFAQWCKSISALPLFDFMRKIGGIRGHQPYLHMHSRLWVDYTSALDGVIECFNGDYYHDPSFNPQCWSKIVSKEDAEQAFLDSRSQDGIKQLPRLKQMLSSPVVYPLSFKNYTIMPEKTYGVRQETLDFINNVRQTYRDKRELLKFDLEFFYVRAQGLSWLYDGDESKWLPEERMSLYNFLFHIPAGQVYEQLAIRKVLSTDWPSLNYLLRQFMLMWADAGLTFRFFPPYEILLDGAYRSLTIKKFAVTKYKDKEVDLELGSLVGDVFKGYFDGFFKQRTIFRDMLEQYHDGQNYDDPIYNELLTILKTMEHKHDRLVLESLSELRAPSAHTTQDSREGVRFAQHSSDVAVDYSLVGTPHVQTNVQEAVQAEEQSYKHDQFSMDYIPYFEDVVEEFQASMDKFAVNDLNAQRDDLVSNGHGNALPQQTQAPQQGPVPQQGQGANAHNQAPYVQDAHPVQGPAPMQAAYPQARPHNVQYSQGQGQYHPHQPYPQGMQGYQGQGYPAQSNYHGQNQYAPSYGHPSQYQSAQWQGQAPMQGQGMQPARQMQPQPNRQIYPQPQQQSMPAPMYQQATQTAAPPYQMPQNPAFGGMQGHGQQYAPRPQQGLMQGGQGYYGPAQARPYSQYPQMPAPQMQGAQMQAPQMQAPRSGQVGPAYQGQMPYQGQQGQYQGQAPQYQAQQGAQGQYQGSWQGNSVTQANYVQNTQPMQYQQAGNAGHQQAHTGYNLNANASHNAAYQNVSPQALTQGYQQPQSYQINDQQVHAGVDTQDLPQDVSYVAGQENVQSGDVKKTVASVVAQEQATQLLATLATSNFDQLVPVSEEQSAESLAMTASEWEGCTPEFTNSFGTKFLSYFEVQANADDEAYKRLHDAGINTLEEIEALLAKLNLNRPREVCDVFCKVNAINCVLDPSEEWDQAEAAFSYIQTIEPQEFTESEQLQFKKTLGLERAILRLYTFAYRRNLPFTSLPSFEGMLRLLVETMIRHRLDLGLLPDFPELFQNTVKAICEDDQAYIASEARSNQYSESRARLPFAWALFKSLEEVAAHGLPVKRVSNYLDYPVYGAYYGFLRRFFFKMVLRDVWKQQINFNSSYTAPHADKLLDFRYKFLSNDFDSSCTFGVIAEYANADFMKRRRQGLLPVEPSVAQAIKPENYTPDQVAYVQTQAASVTSDQELQVEEDVYLDAQALDSCIFDPTAYPDVKDVQIERPNLHKQDQEHQDKEQEYVNSTRTDETQSASADTQNTEAASAESVAENAEVTETTEVAKETESAADTEFTATEPEETAEAGVTPVVAQETVVATMGAQVDMQSAPQLVSVLDSAHTETAVEPVTATTTTTTQETPIVEEQESVEPQAPVVHEAATLDQEQEASADLTSEVAAQGESEQSAQDQLQDDTGVAPLNTTTTITATTTTTDEPVKHNAVHSSIYDVVQGLSALQLCLEQTQPVEPVEDAVAEDSSTEAPKCSCKEPEPTQAQEQGESPEQAALAEESAEKLSTAESVVESELVTVAQAKKVQQNHVESQVKEQADSLEPTDAQKASFAETVSPVDSVSMPEVNRQEDLIIEDVELTKAGKPRKYRKLTKSIEQQRSIIPIDKASLEATRFAQSISSFQSKVPYPSTRRDYTALAGAVRGSVLAVRMQDAENKFHVSPDERLEYDLGLQYATSLPDPKVLLTGSFKHLADGQGESSALIGDNKNAPVVTEEELEHLHPAAAFFRAYITRTLPNATAVNAANAAFAIVKGVRNKSESEIAQFIQDEFQARNINLNEEKNPISWLVGSDQDNEQDTAQQGKQANEASQAASAKQGVAVNNAVAKRKAAMHEDRPLDMFAFAPCLRNTYLASAMPVPKESIEQAMSSDSHYIRSMAQQAEAYDRRAQAEAAWNQQLIARREREQAEADAQVMGVAPVATAQAVRNGQVEDNDDDSNVIMVISGPSDPNKLDEPKDFRRSKVNVFKTFDNFVPSPETTNVIEVARRIVETPGLVYSPFFVHSASGLGKTHLVSAIANGLKVAHPELVVTYIRAEDFIFNFVITVKHHNDMQNKKNTTIFNSVLYQEILNSDVVIIDDVQNFSKAEKSRNSFFEVIATFMDKPGSQLILASDVSPAGLQAQGFNPRLTSRFAAGICYELLVPSVGARRTIVSAKSSELGIKFSESLIDYLADHLGTNIREIEGAVKSISSQILVNGWVSLRQAATLVSSFIPLPKKFKGKDKGGKEEEAKAAPQALEPNSKLNMETVKKVVARAFKISPADLSVKSKRKDLSTARSMAMLLAKELLHKVTLCEIGMAFKRDHSSVIEAIQRMRTRLATDADLSHFHDFLTNKILHPEDSNEQDLETKQGGEQEPGKQESKPAKQDPKQAAE